MTTSSSTMLTRDVPLLSVAPSAVTFSSGNQSLKMSIMLSGLGNIWTDTPEISHLNFQSFFSSASLLNYSSSLVYLFDRSNSFSLTMVISGEGHLGSEPAGFCRPQFDCRTVGLIEYWFCILILSIGQKTTYQVPRKGLSWRLRVRCQCWWNVTFIWSVRCVREAAIVSSSLFP